MGPLLAFWKLVADEAIGESPEVFNKVLRMFQWLGDKAIASEADRDKHVLDEVFRDLGWLGERLLGRRGIEDKPLMRDRDYQSEYDQLLGTLLSYSHKYDQTYANAYPLIYFDAVDVVLRRVATSQAAQPESNLGSNIFGLVYVYCSFAEAAIAKSNVRGAELAVLRLAESYEVLWDNLKLEEAAKNVVGLLVFVACLANRDKAKLGRVEFLGKPIDEYVMDIVAKTPFQDKVAHEIYERYTKMECSWEFVIESGRRLKTNFGFMFDWETGERYAENDPRRR